MYFNFLPSGSLKAWAVLIGLGLTWGWAVLRLNLDWAQIWAWLDEGSFQVKGKLR